MLARGGSPWISGLIEAGKLVDETSSLTCISGQKVRNFSLQPGLVLLRIEGTGFYK